MILFYQGKNKNQMNLKVRYGTFLKKCMGEYDGSAAKENAEGGV